jgi:hypothetical protein
VTKFDFVIEMLLQTGKIHRERDLLPLLEKFAEDKSLEGACTCVYYDICSG